MFVVIVEFGGFMWGDGFEWGYGDGFEGVELVWLFLVVGLFGGVDGGYVLFGVNEKLFFFVLSFVIWGGCFIVNIG